MVHPSLKEDFVAPQLLKPKRFMRVNERCWCGSGKKWKKCHRDREKQTPEPFGKKAHNLRKEMFKGYCLHPEASEFGCSQNIIRAHTVQRRGGLAGIAENGHVISPKRGFEDIFKNEGQIIPREHGIADASTFMGFCSFHDNQMFEPIEKNPLCLNTESAFLLSFRAICYEYFTKEATLRTLELQKELDKGKPFEVQCSIQQHLHLIQEGSKRAMRDLKSWKSDYDQAFIEKDYSRFSFYGARFSGLLPIVACGAFYPEYDFKGNNLQIITRGTGNFEHVCLNLTSVGGKSVLVFGWTGKGSGPAESLCNSFRELNNKKKSNAAFYTAVEHLENIYFNPSWWESQPEFIKAELFRRFGSGMGLVGEERTAQSLTSFPYILSDFQVEQELS
jgi:hypothetical protein